MYAPVCTHVMVQPSKITVDDVRSVLANDTASRPEELIPVLLKLDPVNVADAPVNVVVAKSSVAVAVTEFPTRLAPVLKMQLVNTRFVNEVEASEMTALLVAVTDEKVAAWKVDPVIVMVPVVSVIEASVNVPESVTPLNVAPYDER